MISIINLGNQYANSYMPSGMVQYTIPPEDIPDVEKAFEWLNEKTAINSMVIVEFTQNYAHKAFIVIENEYYDL